MDALANRRLVVGSVLIDADQYFWFCAQQHCLDPLAAVRFFNQADAPQHRPTGLRHHPVAALALLLLGSRAPRAACRGRDALHVSRDPYRKGRICAARAAALGRDGFSCRRCGARGAGVGTQLHRQPALLAPYAAADLVARCDRCHQAALAERSLRVRAT